MGQVLHGSATTTEAVGRAIQNSQESLRALAKRYGINQKTVAKWKKRTSVADLPTGPKDPHPTVLSTGEEAIVVAFRKHRLLPLDDCLYALQPTIPHLSRSSLHRCLNRHGMSRLPEIEGDKPVRKTFRSDPSGVRAFSRTCGVHALTPPRHCRGPDGRGQAARVRSHRPQFKVCLHRTPPGGRQDGRGPVPARSDRGGSLRHPYGADGQRHPVHQPRPSQIRLPPHLRPGL